MSNFNKQGLRKSKEGERRIYKQRYKAYINLLKTLDRVSTELNKDKEIIYSEDNINEYTKPLLGRDLDPMEVFFVLSKLNNIEIKDEKSKI